MKAVQITHAGGPEVLRSVDCPLPVAGRKEVLVQVAAAGVNRPDIQQRKGLYPPPPGASEIPGLDIAGVVVAVGAGVSRWQVGDPVCALVQGGGYAEFCVAPEEQCLTVPRGFSFEQAASLPEVFFTAWNNLLDHGRLTDRETVLVQGGSSGVGLAAIQLARVLRNARVVVTASSEEKRRAAREAGAELAVDYRQSDWPQEIRSLLGHECIDVILDSQAGDYVQPEIELLATGGRLVLIGLHRGDRADVDLRSIVYRRLTLTGSTIRARDAAFKGRIARQLEAQVWPRLSDGTIITRIHRVFELDDVAEAHQVLDSNQQIGKVVLQVDRRLTT